jgi:hypothetical protein
MSIMDDDFMLNTQAKHRMSNSAANPLPTAKPGENSAAGEFGQIIPKARISNKFSALRGCFLAAEKRFVPAGRGIGSFAS